MDDAGRFIFTKEKPEGGKGPGAGSMGGEGGGGGDFEADPYAGTNIDQQHLGEMMEAGQRNTSLEQEGFPAKVKGEGEGKPQENPPAARAKPRMSVGPDKRLTGLPEEAGNKNVDKRTEGRVR